MNARIYLIAGLALVLAASLEKSVMADEEQHTQATEAVSSAVTSAESIAAYPLTTCVVSGDKLEDGDMGPPINFVYKQEGKPDRLVRFCCKGCIKDFKKDPAKYLKMIDDAASQADGSASKTGDGHAGHNH